MRGEEEDHDLKLSASINTIDVSGWTRVIGYNQIRCHNPCHMPAGVHVELVAHS